VIGPRCAGSGDVKQGVKKGVKNGAKNP